MKKWEKFEVQASNFLNKKYNSIGLNFKNVGGSDSNAADIRVYSNEKHLFNIEAKLSPSQSGQFVVKRKNKKYVFSKENSTKNNEHSQKIIDYINENLDQYNEVKQSALTIDYMQEILEGWIIKHYQNKKNKFIIVSNNLNSYMALIPIEELPSFFDVEANLRRKKSGTRHLPKRERNFGIKLLQEHLLRYGINLIGHKFEGKKTKVKLDESLNGKDQLIFGEGAYWLSRLDDNNIYYIKKRSKTNNINVVFSLTYKGPKEEYGYKNFENFVKENFL